MSKSKWHGVKLKGRVYLCNLVHKGFYRYDDARRRCIERKGFNPEYIDFKSTEKWPRYLYICWEFQEDYDRTHLNNVLVRQRHPEWYDDDDLSDWDDWDDEE